MRILVTDRSEKSREALDTLEEMKIDFFEITIEKIARINFEVPLLLAPEGRFEGLDLVKMYSKAEKNGFHEMLVNKRTSR